ncbi:beta-lactamase family protein [Muricauda sp. CAU 1633]|uniref:serine hydrolase domain-containing protein n=1 Tax=Allomuricauda sp. CAU 1633 TaxID=2816036 RepID=UPI001A8CAC8D|nr:serine hydrolase domain-containing protein [Muricauda sp. CAU 1633]MBO0323604.1 beta-lactamase family protein [Muricauda sp. CAU 1633]
MTRIFAKLLFCTAFLWVGLVSAQLENKIAQIDSLFLDWNQPNHPGGAVAIMQGDKILFSKAYGLASMEYLVPNTTGTRFNVASVSKQFSALGIVLLHLQGKLSVDDTIDTYMDGLPNFGQKITIRQMLHHTSGLRSLHALFGLAGWRDDDVRTNADLDRIIAQQNELNFEPGSEYMYCNTGYMFLVNIIEKVTGKSFVEYMKDEVFEPLGMYDSYAEPDYNRIMPNNATSYNAANDSFVRAVEYWAYIGSGNVHTTIADLSKYLKNYYQPTPGWEKAFKMMQTVDTLNDGSANPYAFGVIVDDLHGVKRISHGGSIGGFRSHVSVFPEEKTSIVVLTNFSSSYPAPKSTAAARILFDKTNGSKNLKTIKVPEQKLQSYVGLYWDDVTYQEREILSDGDKLFLGNGNSETTYVPIEKEKFVALDAEDESHIEFKDGTMLFHPEGAKPLVFEKLLKEKLTPQLAEEYIGTYFSPEIETAYTIHYQNDSLYAHHIRHGKLSLQQKRKDLLEGSYPLNFLKFKRNAEGEIEGVFISNGRVRNLWFKKTD